MSWLLMMKRSCFCSARLAPVLAAVWVAAALAGPVHAGGAYDYEFVAFEGDTIDGVTVTGLGSSEVSINNNGDVLFTALIPSSFSVLNFVPFGLFSPTQALVKSSDVIDGRTITLPSAGAINDAGDVVFTGVYRDGRGFGGNLDGIFDLNRDKLIISQLDPISRGTDTGTISEIRKEESSSFLNDQGQVVFITKTDLDPGFGNIKTLGVSRVNLDGTDAQVLVDRADVVGGVETLFHRNPSINNQGHVVFASSGTNGPGGVFSLTNDQLVVTTGDVIGGITIDFASRPTINNHNELFFVGNYDVDPITFSSTQAIFNLDGPLVTVGDEINGLTLIEITGTFDANDQGDLAFAGVFLDEATNTEFRRIVKATVVPEPTTAALLAAALLGSLPRRRRPQPVG